MAKLPNLKRGDTFSYTATWPEANLSELKSQVRDKSGKLMSEVEIAEVEGSPFSFVLTVSDTTQWPVGTLYTDIQRTYAGTIRSSETISFKIDQDVTQ